MKFGILLLQRVSFVSLKICFNGNAGQLYLNSREGCNEACSTILLPAWPGLVFQVFFGMPLAERGSIQLAEGLRILFLVYSFKKYAYQWGQAWWLMPVIPELCEAKAGRLLELRRRRLW